MAERAAPGARERPVARTRARRRPGGRAAADRGGGAAARGRRWVARRDVGLLFRRRWRAGGVRAAAVRAPEHRSLPAQAGHRADRPGAVEPAGRAGAAGRARRRAARPGPRLAVTARLAPGPLVCGDPTNLTGRSSWGPAWLPTPATVLS